jgi:tetratricopeptide (TPR) repeat protein
MENQRLNLLLAMHLEQPQECFVLFALAKEYEKLGQKEEALRYYELLETNDAQYVGLYYHLGKLHEAMEAPDQAAKVYRAGKTVAKAQGDQHAYSELAGALLNISDDE